MTTPLTAASRVDAARTVSQDHVLVCAHEGLIVAVVADGAGGMSGGGEAAAHIIERVRQVTESARGLIVADTWRRLLREVSVELLGVGQSTAVVVATDGSVVVGASVGDSGAWLVGPDGSADLSHGQRRKPLLGGGDVEPHAFTAARSTAHTLLLATDGLLKYTTERRIRAVVAAGERLDACCASLVDLVRLPTGGLQDDVGVVLIR